MENQREYIDLKKIFFRYLKEWKLIGLSVFCFAILAIAFSKIVQPVYEVNANILIKQDKGSKGGASSLLKGFGMGIGGLGSSVEIEDELHIIYSYSIFKQAVSVLKLNETFTEKKLLGLKSIDRYAGNVIDISYDKAITDTLGVPLEFYVKINKDGLATVKFKNVVSKKDIFNQSGLAFPVVMNTEWGNFTLNTTDAFKKGKDYRYEIKIYSLGLATEICMNDVSILMASKKSNVIELSTLVQNRTKGKDILNYLIELYNEDAMRENNYVSQNTSAFLRDRLSVISKELAELEMEIEHYKKDNNILHVEFEAQSLLDMSSEMDKALMQHHRQEAIINELISCIENTKNNDLIPSALMFDAGGTDVIIEEYNKLILERISLLQSTNEANPVFKKFDAQIDLCRNNLLASVKNAKNNLVFNRMQVESKISGINERSKNAPKLEREYLDIKRRQLIKEQLVIFLMEKQEENELSVTLSTPRAKIIDEAYSKSSPKSPKSMVLLLGGMFLGVFVAVAGITAYDFLNVSFKSKHDLEPYCEDTPIIGEINAKSTSEKEIDSSFDVVRRNIPFIMTNKSNKIILVSSANRNDGKTYVASNLAISMAKQGKRILFIDLDLRSSGVRNLFNINNQRGMSDFIIDDSISKDDIINKTNYNNLSVILTGTLPPNPAEIIASDRIRKLIDEVKADFDYIIIDTASVCEVSDTFALGKIADKMLFVIKAGVTTKDNIRMIKEIAPKYNLANLFFILNGVNSK